MDLSPVRALALDINFSVHGLDCRVTPIGESTIETRCIWTTPSTDASGFDVLRRQEARRVLALTRLACPDVPRGSIIEAPDRSGGAELRWRVDGVESAFDDHIRYYVIKDPEGPLA